MEVYPGRVYSKPEFTALEPYIFSGADFALMPSRDEPFGLVAVEFGRKGALCIGARVGGLGQMPGWWFTIESTTTKHVIQQFKIACQGALASKPEVRAIMRARAAKQRFPVAQWVEDLEKLQSTAIEISQKQQSKASRQSLFAPSGASTPTQSRRNTQALSHRATPAHSRNGSRNASRAPSPLRSDSPPPPLPSENFGSRLGPGQRKKLKRRRGGPSVGPVTAPVSAPVSDAEDSSDEEVPRASRPQSRLPIPSGPPSPMETPSPQFPSSPQSLRESRRVSAMSFNPQNVITSPNASTALITPSASGTRLSENWLPDSGPHIFKQSNSTLLSLPAVIGETSDYKLQHVSPFFTDPKQEFTGQYSKKLEKLNGKTSEDQLCIEEYLVKSEKTWFGQMRAAQMGKSPMPSPAVSVMRFDRHSQGSSFDDTHSEPPMANETEVVMDEFLLGPDYVAPRGLKHALRLRIGDWPLYSILLAFVSLPCRKIGDQLLLTSLFHRVKSLQPTPIKSPSLPAPSAKPLTSCTRLPRFILLARSYGGSSTAV